MTYRLAILAVIAVCTFAGSAVGTLRANQSDASAASVVTNSEPRWGTRACSCATSTLARSTISG
jgi:hypothetical protein